MGLFDRFPTTKLNDINLDWILKIISRFKGGNAGQYLRKRSNANFDFYWSDSGGGGGEDGATFTPSVSEQGIISWTNDKGLPNPEPVDIMGPAGQQGEQGPAGQQGEQGPAGQQGPRGQNAGNNLLDNWYFANPVNQRGQASYSTGGQYTIDRWKLTSGNVSVVSGGLALNGTIAQILEQSIGQTVIASALLSDGTMITPTYDDLTRTLTLTASNKTIVAVKLELGTEQTLAHETGGVYVLNEIADYAETLEKCKRYYRVMLNDYVYTALRRAGSSIIEFAVPAAMRVTSDLSISSSAFYYADDSQLYAVSNARLDWHDQNNEGILIYADVGTTFATWGNSCVTVIDFKLSADL